MLRGVLLAFGAATLIGLTLALPARLTDADAQGSTAPAYEIDVLPGVADGDPTNAKRWSIDAAGNATGLTLLANHALPGLGPSLPRCQAAQTLTDRREADRRPRPFSFREHMASTRPVSMTVPSQCRPGG